MYSGLGTIYGAIIFLTTVVTLHLVQPHYDPIHQHLSELAQGDYGSMMLVGFLGFGFSIFFAQNGLRSFSAPKPIRCILGAAAICIAGAGIFKLDKASEIHVSLITLAFMLLVISMYLLPRLVKKFSSTTSRNLSWFMAGGTALSVSLGGTIPEGVAQRAAAICILSWLLWVGSVINHYEAEQRRASHAAHH